MSNGYLLKFINRYKSQSTAKLPFDSAEKTSVYICLPVRDEPNSMIFRRGLIAAI